MLRFLPSSWFCAIAVMSTAGLLHAQEYRATILGIVTDPSGSVIPSARATAVNAETGVRTATRSNNEGNYIIPYLDPGTYRLTVESSGFRTTERSGLQLQMNQRMRIDVTLPVGEVSEKITLTAESPLLDTASASGGQTLETRKVADLPISKRNTILLTNLATGVQFDQPVSLKYLKPYDNTVITSFSINGGQRGQNEFQVDGVPNTALLSDGYNTVAYVPPVESVQEFRVQTNTYDAQYGRTSGGVINTSSKQGTNQWHGAAYEHLQRLSLNANTFENNAAGMDRSPQKADTYGLEIDGPVRIPKVFDGRNRTFFMINREGNRDWLYRPATFSVPTDLERTGDFSRSMTRLGALNAVYDPLTVRLNPAFDPTKAVTLTNSQYIRSPFPGNVVPSNRFDPVGKEVMNDILPQNQVGDRFTAANNYFFNFTIKNNYQNWIGRLDHIFNDRWKLFGRGIYSDRINSGIHRSLYSSGRGRYSDGLLQGNKGAVLDAVGTLSPSSVFDLRLGVNRLDWNNVVGGSPAILSLGFPTSLLKQLQQPDKYPYITLDGYLNGGYGPGTNNETIALSENYSLQTTMLSVRASHAIKYGFEYRVRHFMPLDLSLGAGTYAFNRGWTGPSAGIIDPNNGSSPASLLLGAMASGSVPIQPALYNGWHYPVFFFHDDWRVTKRLSLSLGLRWDYETAPVERFNRQNRGFDASAQSPYRVSGLELRGGLLFAGLNGQPRGGFDPDRNNWQPRFGLAYHLLKSKPLVFRGGFGRYFLPAGGVTGGQLGFSATTQAQVSTADYHYGAPLSNPFPNGLVLPAGASGGLATGVGGVIGFTDTSMRIPNVWQFSAGFQYELAPGTLVDAAYVGSQTRQLGISRNINYLTVEQLAMGTPYLNQVVANPFYGLLAANTPLGGQATIQRRALMLPYPQFTSVTEQGISTGESWYHSLQLRIERRLKHGVAFLVSLTVSKSMEAVDLLNPQDAKPVRELGAYDTPRRLVVSGVWELPFGNGRMWLRQGWPARILGGWQISGIETAQSGMPMSLPNYIMRGDPKLSSGQTFSRWFDTSPSLWGVPASDTLRLTPLRSSNIRVPTVPQLDGTLQRSIRIREGHRMQIRCSAYNLTNTPLFAPPNSAPSAATFGMVTLTQVNASRTVELGFRYVF
jgi:hypothetical protein